MSDFATPTSKNDELNSAANPFHHEISHTGAAVSTGNPLPVVVVGTPEVVTKIHSYDQANVNGNNTTSNHDYTIVGSSFRLHKILLTSESKFEAEVQVGPLATLVTKGKGKVNTIQMSDSIVFDPPIDVPATGTGTIRVIRRRRQAGADDVQTTIMGYDVA